MRQLLGWFSVVVFACGCHDNHLVTTSRPPIAPTPIIAVAPTPTSPYGPSGNWTPYFFKPWQPGIGAPLGLNAAIDAAVEVNELCVPDIYEQWGARACKRFVVSMPSAGWLHAFLKWDSSASGFDPKLAGEVVIVAPTGQFATSDVNQTDNEAFARVEPVAYDVLVLSYAQQVRLPFRLRTELRPN